MPPVRTKRKARKTTSTAASSQPGHTLDNQPNHSHEEIVASVLEALKHRGVLPMNTPNNEADSHQEHLAANQNNSSDTADRNQSELMSQVQQALQVEPDQPITTGNSHPQVTFDSSLSPGALVSDKLKQSIWNGEFIDFNALLHKRTEPDEVMIKVSAARPNISVAQCDSDKQLPMSKWISAFLMFMDIRIQKYPNEASPLLTYMNIIRDLDRVHGATAFNYYDKNFRIQRQVKPVPWGSLHHELWIKATTAALASQTQPQNNNKYCFKFNKIQGCSNKTCIYQHICSFCRKPHPVFRCFTRQKNTLTPQTSSQSGGSRPLPKQLEKTSNQSFRANNNTRQK